LVKILLPTADSQLPHSTREKDYANEIVIVIDKKYAVSQKYNKNLMLKFSGKSPLKLEVS
jgi:hypothetical protein